MPQALDPSGAPVEVPPEELAAKWQSRAVALVGGSRYDVRLPDGRVGTVPAESLHEALQSGAQVLPTGAAQRQREAEQYGGAKGMAIAAASGFGEQATLGAVDHALPDSWRSAIAKSQRQNPGSTMLGETGGVLALGAATGGAGEALGLGGALAGGVGGAVERGAADLVGGFAKSAVGRAATRAAVQSARGVAEGAQYGAARSIADSALDPEKHPLTAAAILSSVGSNALWGGALGAGLGTVGGALHELHVPREAPPTALDGALGDARAPAANDVGEVVSRATGGEPASKGGLGQMVKNWATRLSSAVSGASADDIAIFHDAENRAALEGADELRATASRDVRESVDDVLKSARTIQQEGQRTLKRGHIEAAVRNVDPVEAAESARNMVDHSLARLHGMLAEPDTYGSPKALDNAITFTEQYQATIEQAITSGDVAGQYAALDELKKGIGKYTRGASALNPRGATDELVAMQNKARAGVYQDLYETLRGGLEDEETWGDAGAHQKAVNSAWTRQIEASDRFHRALTTEVGRDPENSWQTVRGVDPAKADNYVRNLTNPSQDLTHKAVTDYVTSSRDLAHAMREQWELPPAKLAAVDTLEASANKFQDVLDRTSKSLSVANTFERIRQASSGGASSFLSAAGYVTGGRPGGLTGMALGKLGSVFTRPADTIMQVARVEGMVRRSDSRMAGAIKGFLRGTTREPRAVDMETFERKSSQVAALAGAPNEVAARVHANVGRLGATSPGLAMALTAATVTGLQFLQARLPVSLPDDPLDVESKPPPPPASQRESWLHYYAAVKDPVTVLEDLHAGRLSLEGAEVLRTVYPPLFARARELFGEELQRGHGADLTAQQRVGVALLLDIDVPELAQPYLAANQAGAAPQQPPGQPQQGGRNGKPLKLANPSLVSDRVESGLQKE